MEYNCMSCSMESLQPKRPCTDGAKVVVDLSGVPDAPTRAIRWAADSDVIPQKSPLDELDEVEQRAMWYNLADLETFRNEARCMGRNLRSNERFCTLARDYRTRGLEQRSCMERQRRKYLATKCILRAQYTLEAARLAMLAHKCTAWAADLAVEEAARDYERAYIDSRKRIVENLTTVSDSDESERRVRPRLIEILEL